MKKGHYPSAQSAVRTEDHEADIWIKRLLDVGVAVRNHLAGTTNDGSRGFTMAVAHESGDTIFGIDRHVEPVIEREIGSWDSESKPMMLIAEGMGYRGQKRFGPSRKPIRNYLLVDPIDGTRALMYDKRSAWFLAALARNSGEEPTLAQTYVSVMVELPTRKQGWADCFFAHAGGRCGAFRERLDTGLRRPLSITPSKAESLLNGFGQVSNFFPGTKVLASELMERIAVQTLNHVRPGYDDIFDDQYISSAGQIVELLVGHDRFSCDLRPLFYQILQMRSREKVFHGLECHPYDLAGLLIAKQAGLVITDGFGRPLNCPFDVFTGVHWCGYANKTLQGLIQPVITGWLSEKGLTGPPA